MSPSHTSPNRPSVGQAVIGFAKSAGQAVLGVAESHVELRDAARNGGQLSTGFIQKKDPGRSL